MKKLYKEVKLKSEVVRKSERVIRQSERKCLKVKLLHKTKEMTKNNNQGNRKQGIHEFQRRQRKQ